jgi:hypothetical protein
MMFNSLPTDSFSLLVSLPHHDVALARAASEAGAHAIKVHCNVEHKASGTRFGSWKEEKPVILQIMDAVQGPVGLMPGSTVTVTPTEMQDAIDSGVQFIDIYDFDMPPWMWPLPLFKMVAVGSGYQLDEVRKLESRGADGIEASIVPSTQYGQPLTAADLNHYSAIVNATSLPVWVPSQKHLLPQDMASLKKAGVKGVILGVISLGKTADEFREKIPFYLKGAINGINV